MTRIRITMKAENKDGLARNERRAICVRKKISAADMQELKEALAALRIATTDEEPKRTCVEFITEVCDDLFGKNKWAFIDDAPSIEF